MASISYYYWAINAIATAIVVIVVIITGIVQYTPELIHSMNAWNKSFANKRHNIICRLQIFRPQAKSQDIKCNKSTVNSILLSETLYLIFLNQLSDRSFPPTTLPKNTRDW